MYYYTCMYIYIVYNSHHASHNAGTSPHACEIKPKVTSQQKATDANRGVSMICGRSHICLDTTWRTVCNRISQQVTRTINLTQTKTAVKKYLTQTISRRQLVWGPDWQVVLVISPCCSSTHQVSGMDGGWGGGGGGWGGGGRVGGWEGREGRG